MRYLPLSLFRIRRLAVETQVRFGGRSALSDNWISMPLIDTRYSTDL
jgi:hypothetical protein